MAAKEKKITKREMYLALSGILEVVEDVTLPEGVTVDGLIDFINHEIELLDNKTAAAQKRAAQKKAEGDELREKILEVLSTDDYMTIAQIVDSIDYPDLTPQKVTARLTQLSKLEKVEKDFVPVETSEGKSKKMSAYRAKA